MIPTLRSKIGVPQNEGWLDRTLRVVAGMVMLFGPAFLLEFDYIAEANWIYYVMLSSILPITTGVLGWCPLYQALGICSCGGSERNPCGTYPYEIDAALGHHPIPDSEIEHSLETAHHKHTRQAA